MNFNRKWAFILLIPLIWLMLRLLLRSKPVGKPILVAHRGAAGLAPENTLSAIQTGLMHGAEAIEIDIQRSADGVVMLMHDAQVDSTTNGSGLVADLAWADIRQLDAGSYFSLTYAGERVPPLEEALALIKGDSATLLIDVKEPQQYPGLAQELATIIERSEAQTRVIVISFDHDWIADFQALVPDIPVGLLSSWPLQRPQVPTAKLIGVVWPTVFLDPTLVYRMRQAGHLVFVYTVNEPQLMRWLLALGVDGIITDRPDLWSQAIA